MTLDEVHERTVDVIREVTREMSKREYGNYLDWLAYEVDVRQEAHRQMIAEKAEKPE